MSTVLSSTSLYQMHQHPLRSVYLWWRCVVMARCCAVTWRVNTGWFGCGRFTRVSLASNCRLSSRLTAILDGGVDCARQPLGGATSRPLASQLNTTVRSAWPQSQPLLFTGVVRMESGAWPVW